VAGPRRIVSLSPGITETLYALGAGGEVVGLSEYASWPPETASVPKVGSTLTPDYEAIARLKPTLIIDEQVKQAPAGSLSALAPLKVLPWLTVEDMVRGIHELGQLTGREAAARQLAERVAETLERPAPPDAPRALLVLGDTEGMLSSIWYMRRGTLHGAALEAAGARNAVDEEAPGPPSLSLERLISLDPEVILVLVAKDRLEPEEAARQLAAWKRLSVLRAVQQDRVKLVHGPGVQSTGPRILDLVEQLRAALGPGGRAP
jgi:iron complex transport system substrate-binding protein